MLKNNSTEFYSKSYGHCTLLVRDDNYAVGCAASQYTSQDGYTWFNFICNYASNNFLTERVCESGTATSKCATGVNINFPNLCSPDEMKNEL